MYFRHSGPIGMVDTIKRPAIYTRTKCCCNRVPCDAHKHGPSKFDKSLSSSCSSLRALETLPFSQGNWTESRTALMHTVSVQAVSSTSKALGRRVCR